MHIQNSLPVSQKDLISVIVPVYNIESYLPHSLKCLSEQTYKNIEFILVDDASEDESGRILDAFAVTDNRAIVIHHDRNYGLSAARNTGLEAAKGNYIWFPDGDDYFHQEFLQLLYNAINKDGGYDVAIAGWKKTFKMNEDIDSIIRPEYGVLDKESFFSFVFEKTPDIWNKLFKKSILETISFKPYPRAQSRDFNLRLSFRVHRAIYVYNCLYYWFQRPNSLSKSSDAKELYLSCWSAMYFDIYKNCPSDGKYAHRLLLSHLFYKMIQWRLLVMGRPQQQSVFNQSQAYAKQTRWAYLRCHGISFKEKVVCLILFYFPHFVYYMNLYKKQGPKTGFGLLRYKVACFLLSFAYI